MNTEKMSAVVIVVCLKEKAFLAPKQRLMSNSTMSQKTAIFMSYQRQAPHIASALQLYCIVLWYGPGG